MEEIFICDSSFVSVAACWCFFHCFLLDYPCFNFIVEEYEWVYCCDDPTFSLFREVSSSRTCWEEEELRVELRK